MVVLSSEGLEELLRFTLASSVDGTLQMDLCLSKHFCSGLLRDEDDPGASNPTPTGSFQGLPPYPLYKHLASVLHQSITRGALKMPERKVECFSDCKSLQQIEEWDKLVLEKGSELVAIFDTIGSKLHVEEPFFSQLKDGLKTIEGRCATGDYTRIGPGDLIIINKSVVLKVQDVRWHSSFYEMLEQEGLENVLPGVSKIEEGVQIYRKFYTEEKERRNGVLAISVAKSSAQPCNSLARILSGLNYSGIQSLLGLAQTVGTVSEELSPPRSALMSSFMLQHNPNKQYPDQRS